MKLEVLLGSSLVLFAAGRAHAAPDPWCGKGDNFRISITEGDHFRYNTEADDSADPDALVSVVGALCYAGEDETVKQYHAQLEAARARWSKRLGMIDSDWADAVEYAQLETWRRRTSQIDLDLDHRAWSEYTPVEQFVALRRKTGTAASMLDHDYLADALGTKLTEAGRIAYIYDCVEYDEADPVRWAMCQADIETFDLGKLGAELRADKAHSGADRMTIRLATDKVLHELIPRQRARLEPLEKRDPAYAKLFEIAAGVRKDWAAVVQANAAALDSLSALDDLVAKDVRASKFTGCEDKTRTAFAAAVSAIPATEFASLPMIGPPGTDVDGKWLSLPAQAMNIVMKRPAAYLAGAAYAICAANTSTETAVTAAIGAYVGRVAGFRGPRNAALDALEHAGIELEARGEKLKFPTIARAWLMAGGGRGDAHTAGTGQLSKVTVNGSRIHIEFKPVIVKFQRCTRAVMTNRLIMIMPNGELIYERQCLASAPATENIAHSPMDLDTAVAGGLKVGMVVLVESGIPIAAWTKPDAKLPSIVLGVAVK
jgi:hypothetical protein